MDKKVDLIPSDYVVAEYREEKKSEESRSSKNKLLHLADRIFASATQLIEHQQFANESAWRERLDKEMVEFSKSAEKFGYARDQILIAEYALKAYLNERFQSKNQHIKPFKQLLQKKEDSPDYFFSILEKISKQSDRYLDVIELMYFVLNLGFKGKFRNYYPDQRRLHRIIDQTYAIIRSHRGDFRRQLSSIPDPEVTRPKRRYFLSTIFTISLIVLIFAGIYFSFNSALSIFSKQLMQQFQTLTNG